MDIINGKYKQKTHIGKIYTVLDTNLFYYYNHIRSISKCVNEYSWIS